MKSFKTLSPLLLLAALVPPATAGGSDNICRATAKLQKQSAFFELKEELRVETGVCLNLTDPVAQRECLRNARSEYREGKELAREQFQARLELCELLGGAAYDPDINPAQFTNVINNPYLPLPVGAIWNYESLTEDGLETIQVTVLAETREILGVECVSVRDVVYLGGEPIEDTIDWYAQDQAGNVWYFGEISFNFEDGYVADIEGSWLAGVDGAKPGIVMLATPTVGTTYRQEWLLGDAEDAATVLADDASVTIGIGTFANCVQTADFLPPEPDALEHKYYAPGIGFIYETKVGETETLELISYSGL